MHESRASYFLHHFSGHTHTNTHRLTDGCENLYSQTTTGIGPGSFNWDAETPNTATKNATNNVPFSNTTFYQKSGFWINGDLPGNGYVDGGQGYGLNPEVVESFYYAC